VENFHSAERKEWIDNVLSTALARSPADRYQTPQAFVNALSDPHTALGDSSRVRSPTSARQASVGIQAPQVDDSWRPDWRQRARWSAPAAAIVIGVAALLSIVAAGAKLSPWRRWLAAPPIDSARVAVLPFAGTAPQRDRAFVANRLYAALGQWSGLPLTADEDVTDAIAKEGVPTSPRAASALARRIGVGRFVWGQMDVEDSLHARVQLYDIGSPVAFTSVRLENARDPSVVGRAVQKLLQVPNRPASADGGDGRTTSYKAWNAYGRGHAAIAAGDFLDAERNFRAAVTADPAFSAARVWLAQTLAWRAPGSQGDWREQIAQGLRSPALLSDHDRILGTAVANMAEHRFPEACGEYAKLTNADSTDFVGLYGLGQCHALDSLVVVSATSPSQWRFRARYADAADAYIRALEVNPGAHSILPFSALVELLPTASTKTRRGRSTSGQEFAAYPALIHDTVVFVPYPLVEFASLPAAKTANSHSAALSANSDILLDFTSDWTRRAPTSSLAFQALADVLEVRGEITRNRSGGLSAIQAIIRARQVAETQLEQQLATGKEAWLRFKQGEFVRARLIADSLLLLPATNRDDAEALIGLAALTGKIGKFTELGRVTSNYSVAAVTVPVPVMDAAAPFFAFAALGVCTDTTKVLERRLDDQLLNYVAENQVALLRQALKARPLSMLAPCTAGKSSLGVQPGSNRLIKLQQAFAKSDMRTLTALLLGVTEDAKTQRPGDISLDFTYQVAWLRVAIGDTAAAVRLLDGALDALPALSPPSLRDAASAASAGRAMVLRAEIANRQGDREAQQKWARAVVDLWATADQPLQPVVAKMRVLASQPSSK
jgi:tetratricopeptide (TPR) repeat protein